MHELWKKIEYPSVPKDVKHYEVSNFGRVRRGSIIEKLTQEQNGDVTVILLSLNGDYVGPDSTPPKKYVVAKLYWDACTSKIEVFDVGGEPMAYFPKRFRESYHRCRPRFSQHPLANFKGYETALVRQKIW